MPQPETSAIFDEIEKATSLSALWAMAVRYFRETGFESGSYILLERTRTDAARFMLNYGVPQEVLDQYIAMDGRFSDPLIRVALSSGRPQQRDHFHDQFTLMPDEARLIEAMRRHEFVDAVGEMVALPLYGPHGNNAACRLYSLAGVKFVEELNLNALQMAAQHMHLKALALRPREPAVPQLLSRREVEILLWVAKGKSNSVIATLLGIASGTVDTYLRRIFEKLDVADRTTAAVKGISLGVIRV